VGLAMVLCGCVHLERTGQELRRENFNTVCSAPVPFAKLDPGGDAVRFEVVQRTPCQSSYDSIVEVERSAALDTPARVALAIAIGAAVTGLGTLVALAIAPFNGDPRIGRDVPYLMLVPGLGAAIFGYPLTGTAVARPPGTATSPKVQESPTDVRAADTLLATGTGAEVVLREGKVQLSLEEAALPLTLEGQAVALSLEDRERLAELAHCRAALAQPVDSLVRQAPTALMALRREADACEDAQWNFTRAWLLALRAACAAQGIDCRQ
jgi:hypothetical protein